MTRSIARTPVAVSSFVEGGATRRRAAIEHRWRSTLAVAVVIGVASLGATTPARAIPFISANVNVCGGMTGDPCHHDGVAWNPGDPTVSRSIAHAWSDTNAAPGYTYNLVASAQSSIAGPSRWSGAVSVGGYANNGFYGFNGVSAVSNASVEDDFLFPSTATWTGAGYFRLTYHVTGSTSHNYEYIGTGASGDGRNVSENLLQFSCFNTHSGSCIATGIDYIDTGLYREALESDFDRLITFYIPVRSDVADFYRIDTLLEADMSLYGNADPGRIEGGAQADFSHTFALVDADLLDANHLDVPDWSVVASSGFDYAHLAAVGPTDPPPPVGAVPEPASFALLGLGAAGACFLRRRPRIARDGEMAFA